MARDGYLGDFELIVLLALLRLRAGAYGMLVRQEIERRTGRDISIGAVYATLDRLEAKSYVASSLGESTPERGGRARRTFVVTAEGAAAVERTRAALRAMMRGVPAVEGGRA